MRLSLLLSAIPAALAFTNTASFGFLNLEHGLSSSHMVDASELQQRFESLTKEICQANKKVFLMRKTSTEYVRDPYQKSWIEHVHYTSADSTDLPVSNACGSILFADGRLPADFLDYQVAIIDVDSEDDYLYNLHTIREKSHESSLMIQYLPSFKAPEFNSNEISENDLELDHTLPRKDTNSDESSTMEEEDQDLYISELETKAQNKTGSAGKKSNSLFANYQYFTPGIFQCGLVSIILISIMYVALSWITSIEISYHAFEKQMDFEKKTQ